MTPTSTEVFGETVRQMVKGVGSTFEKPDDDWICMLFFEDKNGDPGMTPLPPQMFENDQTKDLLVALIAHMLRHMNVKRYALLLNGWMLKTSIPRDVEESAAQAEEQLLALHAEWSGHYDKHPESVEVLSLVVADSEQSQMWLAEIKRTEDAPPTLDTWQKGGEDGGRFSVLAEVLKEINSE